MCEAEREQREDAACYSHSLFMPKRLKSIWCWLLQPDPPAPAHFPENQQCSGPWKC